MHADYVYYEFVHGSPADKFIDQRVADTVARNKLAAAFADKHLKGLDCLAWEFDGNIAGFVSEKENATVLCERANTPTERWCIERSRRPYIRLRKVTKASLKIDPDLQKITDEFNAIPRLESVLSVSEALFNMAGFSFPGQDDVWHPLVFISNAKRIVGAPWLATQDLMGDFWGNTKEKFHTLPGLIRMDQDAALKVIYAGKLAMKRDGLLTGGR